MGSRVCGYVCAGRCFVALGTLLQSTQNPPENPPSSWRHPAESASGSPPDAHVGGLRHPTNPAPHGANRADVDWHEDNASEMAPLSRVTGTWWTPPGQGSMALFSYQFVSGACRNVIRDTAPRDFLLRTRDPSTAADGARGAQRWILIGTCLQKAS